MNPLNPDDFRAICSVHIPTIESSVKMVASNYPALPPDWSRGAIGELHRRFAKRCSTRVPDCCEAYIHRIAQNLAKSDLKKRQVWANHAPALAYYNHQRAEKSEAPHSDEIQRLSVAMSELGQKERRLIELHAEGRDYLRIAELLEPEALAACRTDDDRGRLLACLRKRRQRALSKARRLATRVA